MALKLHFEPDLDFQLHAIDAVCDLFEGQDTCQTEFTVSKDAAGTLPGILDELGIGNRLKLLDEEILANLDAVQLRNGLAQSETLVSGDFTIEMETGTGKTYVYLRTIFELNKRFGFSKFVIVVPSIAIKEGVYKSLEMTDGHFRSLYAGAPFDYFLYDSSKLGQVRNFATSANIQIMVVTVGAINKKDVNNLYKDSEKTGGEKPIDLIRATRPVVIVDEPQSVDGGLQGAGKAALDAMTPLCTLRYSATHADKHHMVYRLDAVDAYERKLVKQIEVASATIENAHNKPYVRLISVRHRGGTILAKVELDVQGTAGVRRSEVDVGDGDDLEQATRREIYRDCRVGEIRVRDGDQFMELRYPGGEVYLRPGEAYGGVDELAVQREMVRRTIKEHLDKELRLRPLGIKVLSLFFVDHVASYRSYDSDGNATKGALAQMFEQEYERFRTHPDYQTLFKEIDFGHAAEEVHDGYFSVDKKGGWSDTAEGNQTGRDNAERAYNLIMRDKERLLSLETPLKFIFSHSALREGWDNPNVFQICALRDIGSERERRQTIGRGLRICVNQQGERVRGFEVNTLTVIARESYEEFAENLQKEIEEDTGIRFGVVEQHQFAAIGVLQADGTTAPLGAAQSKEVWDYLRGEGFIDGHGKIEDALRLAIKAESFRVPERFEREQGEITEILRKLAGRLEIKNADERKQIRINKQVYLDPEFRALWDRIKHKTTYRVQFDNGKLIADCAKALQKAPPIARVRLQWRKADLAIGQAGVAAKNTESAAPVTLSEGDIELPDLLTDLQDRTQLTRRSIGRILVDSGRVDDFAKNPQQFIESAAQAINSCKQLALVEGIKYRRLGDDQFYAQELFEQEELTGYLRNLVDSSKSVFAQTVVDASIERSFAEDLEANAAVILYTKLPGWFTVPTPLGTYNPDWAVLVRDTDAERLYFVVETKGSLLPNNLRGVEGAKIECAREHFEALRGEGNSARYVVVSAVDQLMNYLPDDTPAGMRASENQEVIERGGGGWRGLRRPGVGGRGWG